jgi:predicted outer membrane repeat protein
MIKRPVFLWTILSLTLVISPIRTEATPAITSITSNADLYVDAVNGDDTDGDGSSANPWKTITHALDTISNTTPSPIGITVHLAAGTYNNALGEAFPITMLDGVSLSGVGAYSTIIDAQDSGNRVIDCIDIGTGETIRELTVKNGNGGNNNGGGIYCMNSSPKIENCAITNNMTQEKGGGVYCENSSPTITNCTFSSNSADFRGGGIYYENSSPGITYCTFIGNSAGEGGGIYCFESFGSIITCAFTDNSARDGGGIKCKEYSSPAITNCTFNDNRASDCGGGIMGCTYSSPGITDCTFTNNWAGYQGGAIHCCMNSSATITNCKIIGNSTDGEGGGIYCNVGTTPKIINCIINDNLADDGGGIFCDYISKTTITNCTISDNWSYNDGGGIYCHKTSSTSIVNCILWQNKASETGNEIYPDYYDSIDVTFSDIQGGWGTEEEMNLNHNIDVDPLFVNTAIGDFHLAKLSPCTDAGDNTAPYLALTDFEGDYRIIDGKGNGTATVDMGADELLYTAIKAQVNISPHTINVKSKGNYISCHIELPDGMAGDIDANTIRLEDTIPALPSTIELGDGDGVAALMVSFDRASVHNLLTQKGETILKVTGNLINGFRFEGADTITAGGNSQ